MGVRGWNQFLERKGWIPPANTASAGNLFAWDLFGLNTTTIAKGSVLHVDGLSLCFHIHHVAYHRHTSHLPGSVVGTFQALQLLPSFLPLSLLHEVTKEFVDSLSRCGVQVLVYMDGNKRYESFKEKTEQQRHSEREKEVSALQQFCASGRLPVLSSIEQYEECFPKSQLFITQVIHTLRHLGGIQIVFCDGEADRILAEAATEKVDCFILGLDSDFCFFSGCNYIPLNTLSVTGHSLAGCVLSRQRLAEDLSLPNHGMMVELAILLGNDYVDPCELDEGKPSYNPELVIQFLKEQGVQYRVECSSFPTFRGLSFVRKLYNLEPLDEFVVKTYASSNDNAADSKFYSQMGSRSFSVSDLVLQFLEELMGTSEFLHPIHLRAFSRLKDQKNPQEAPWRPHWDDVQASRCIEKVVARLMRRNLNHLSIRLQPPYAVFNSFLFQSLLQDMRKQAQVIPTEPKQQKPSNHVKQVLPADAHREEILSVVKRSRVTIILGETGCGKSTRIPIMLLNSPPPDGFKRVKMFVSQPRRIAAKSLVERLRTVEPELREDIALRMGHGVREYESNTTRAWFVTTGYLVRLLANNPDHFRDVCYIVVDEVHERSVDTDLLCLLCKRLLRSNNRIRLILMSATLAASIYQDYFGVTEPPVKVGARMFPVQYNYIEDFMDGDTSSAELDFIAKESSKQYLQPPSRKYMEALHIAVAQLVTVIGVPGSSILIFVSGMNDIIALNDLIEQFYIPGRRFICFPIHSDIPFEEQMQVFDSPLEDEVKVVIATNAAESSVTLPDVDNVICLGLCKQITYNPKSHRQMLVPAWISKANAEQRAGRTGRVRPGTVYRIYSQALFDKMESHEAGEMSRIPLDSVILLLKEILPSSEEVIPLLLDCLEPPNITTIDRSLLSLFKHNFITAPSDPSTITKLGKFVAALGIDLTLGALIGLGIQFGVAAESIQLAGVLSFTKDPWIVSNPLIHEPHEYNEMVCRTFASKIHFDANHFSEPFSIMNLMWAFNSVPRRSQTSWCRFHGVFLPRLRRLKSSCENLAERVARFVGVNVDTLAVDAPPCHMTPSMLAVLRVLQVWVFNDSIIELKSPTATEGNTAASEVKAFVVDLDTKKRLLSEDLKQVLNEHRHRFELRGMKTVMYSGEFFVVDSIREGVQRNEGGFLSILEPRLLSYATENSVDFACCTFSDIAAVYFSDNNQISKATAGQLQEQSSLYLSDDLFGVYRSGQRRGIGERACGMWLIGTEGNPEQHRVGSRSVRWRKVWTVAGSHATEMESLVRSLTCDHSMKGTWLRFPWSREDLLDSKQMAFSLQCHEAVTTQDMQDLLSSPAIGTLKTKVALGPQSVEFPIMPSTPLSNASPGSAVEIADAPSWKLPPLVTNIVPEGARVLAVLASGRRRGNFIRLSGVEKKTGEESHNDLNPTKCYVDVHLNEELNYTAGAWRRVGADSKAFVPSNSVPACAIPLDSKESHFCCCANILEVRGGIRAEGLTLLPSKEFVAIALVSFGAGFSNSVTEDASVMEEAAQWLRLAGRDLDYQQEMEQCLAAASEFHEDCFEMGETLQCFPQKVRALLALFKDHGSYEVWESLEENPFIHAAGKPTTKIPRGFRHKPLQIKVANGATNREWLGDDLLSLSEELFATQFSNGQKPDPDSLYSSNLLALLVLTVRQELGSESSSYTMSLDSSDWEIATFSSNGTKWFKARFQNHGFRYTQQAHTVCAGWLLASDTAGARPTSLAEGLSCLPKGFRHLLSAHQACFREGKLFHRSLKSSVQLDSAFWLERNFGSGQLHWYQRADLDVMLRTLRCLVK